MNGLFCSLLEGIEQTAKQTIHIIGEIRELMQAYKHRIRNELPKIYSQDLLNNLFKHPYTKIEFVMEELDVTRITATRYLNLLVDKGFLKKQKIGVSNFYINESLFRLFKDGKITRQKADPIKTVNPSNE